MSDAVAAQKLEVVKKFWDAFAGEAFEEVRFELECLEMLDDLVLSVATQHGTGLSSHTPVAWRDAYLSTVRGSKIVRVQFFADPDDALTAARGSAATE